MHLLVLIVIVSSVMLEQRDTYFQLHLSLTISLSLSLYLFSLSLALSVLFPPLCQYVYVSVPSIFFPLFFLYLLPSLSALISQFSSLHFHLHTQTRTAIAEFPYCPTCLQSCCCCCCCSASAPIFF